MTVRHMQIFLTVCECGNNITKAAEKLFITQPSVTLAIKEIEKHYGILLFDRISRRLYLTEAGNQLREYALRITSLFDDMEKSLRNWNLSGTIRVGASITIGSQFMPYYVQEFSKTHNSADIRVIIGPSYQIEKKLLKNELDIALVETPTHEDNLIAQPYMEDSLAVIAPAKSPFYSGQVLSKNEFIKQHFLLREPESGVREVFDRVMRKEDINITPIWEGMSTMALVNAVINGIGISVVPKRMIYGPLKRGLIHVISVENIDFNRYFYIVHHKDKLLTAMLKDFVNLCKTYQMPSQIHDNADLLCHE